MGSPSRQMLAMARKGLRLELRTALREAVETQTVRRSRAVSKSSSTIASSRSGSRCSRSLEPDQEPLYLIVFTDIGPPLDARGSAQHRPPGAPGDVEFLEAGAEGDARSSAVDDRRVRDRARGAEVAATKSWCRSTRSCSRRTRSWRLPRRSCSRSTRSCSTVNHELAVKVDELHRSQRGSAQPVREHADRDRLPRSVHGHPQLHAGGHGRSSI